MICEVQSATTCCRYLERWNSGAPATAAATGSTAASDAVFAALAASDSPTLRNAATRFATQGVDVGAAANRALFAALDIDDALRAQLLGLATDTHGGDVTAADVVAARAELATAANQRALMERLAEAYNAAAAGIDDGTLTDAAAVKAAFDEGWG